MVSGTIQCEFESHQAYAVPDSVIGNMQEFDSCVAGSSPAPASNVVFSLFGKVPSCDGGEQGSIPGDNRVGTEK